MWTEDTGCDVCVFFIADSMSNLSCDLLSERLDWLAYISQRRAASRAATLELDGEAHRKPPLLYDHVAVRG